MTGPVTNCYNIGEITGTGGHSSNAGGIVGWINRGGVDNCLWTKPNGETYWGNLDASSIGGGTGNKKQENAESDEWLETLGSDFIEDTDNLNNGYPILFWQKK